MARGESAAAQRGAPDPLKAVDWGTETDAPIIDVYFAPEGALLAGDASLGWTRYEKQQALAALATISEVVNLEFRETPARAGAEFRLMTMQLRDTDGEMYAPGGPLAGLARFDPTGIRQGSPQRDGVLDPGSFAFKILLHEFGHGLGLAHLHDRGGFSTVWEGVRGPWGDYGRAALNQGVYSVMSYNDGWHGGPYGPPYDAAFGFEASMMALDVAVLQAKYGANLVHATGDDVYGLPERDVRGTAYACLWDAGGYDTVSHSGRGDAIIDLRAATLLGDNGGGGRVSYVQGVSGGLTIANGVAIEAARGGRGDDMLRGDGAANRLAGGHGDDFLRGGGGADLEHGGRGVDTLVGGGGDDVLVGGRGADVLWGGAGADLFRFHADQGADRIVDFEDGIDRVQILADAVGFDEMKLGTAGGEASVRYDGLRIIFEGIKLAALDAGDFVFG